MIEEVWKQRKKFTMSTYKINFEQLRQQSGITEMLTALERGFEKFDIDFYLIGAVARDVWMSGINKIAPRRTTGDIDFAVLVNDRGTYEELKSYLTSIEAFTAVKDSPYVLLWGNKLEVDLLPFGNLQDEEGQVLTDGLGMTSINLQGFAEVYESDLPEIDLDGKHQFKFCTLPGIVLLKMIAWDDRPEERSSDITDISDILNHYFDMHSNEIWTNHSDLFSEQGCDLRTIAARVMGREMSLIAKRNENVYSRILRILELNTTDVMKSKMADIMTKYFENTVEENVQLLIQLKKGFIE